MDLPADIPYLGVVFPQSGDEESLLGPPLVLPMGWVNSPAYFTVSTENACDLANEKLNAVTSFPSHCLAKVAESYPSANPQEVTSGVTPSLPSGMPSVSLFNHPHVYLQMMPVDMKYIYVDDSLSLVQGNSV
jgi:uncharacterized Zn-finger protein